MRDLFKLILEQMGHQVDVAQHGMEGMQQLKRRPDLVILDLSMPLASGDVVLGFIRSTPELKTTRVLVVSAHPDADRIARDLGANLCLHKPVSVDEVRKAVNELLDQ